MKTYLFIGGPADGKRMETDGYPVWKIESVHRPPMTAYTSLTSYMDFATNVAEYHLIRSSQSGQEVYLHSEIAPSRLIELLIAGYAKQP